MSTDPHEHVLLKCSNCLKNSWAERQDIPAPNVANTHTGTWLRCAHCNAPLTGHCKNIQPETRADGGCLQCDADAGEACRGALSSGESQS